MITFHSFSFLPDWVFLNWEGEERESGREFLSLLKFLCEDGWVSVRYRKGPDHHWMTLLAATKPNWSRPPAANGPERNSPGWVMTVFSAFLFTPFWCPRTPHLTPAATSPVPFPYPCSQPWVPHWPSLSVIYTNTHIHTMLLVTVSACVEHLATDAADRSGRGNQRTICLDETWSSCVSHTDELDGKVSAWQKLGLLLRWFCERNGFNPKAKECFRFWGNVQNKQ